jgi:hypothetical protein
VRNALSQNDEVFSGAIAAANDWSWDQEAVSRRYFGYYHSQAMPSVVRDWSKTHALISDYRREEGAGKFVGIIPYEQEELASVYPTDPHGRLFLNIEKLDSPNFSKVIAHEMTHLGIVTRFEEHAGAETEDNFYLNAKHAAKLRGVVRGSGEAEVSEVIMNKGLTTGYLKNSGSSATQFIKQVSILRTPGSVVNNLKSAITEFNKSPHIASVMASRNADSIVEAAYSFHEAYRVHLLAQQRNR